MRMEIIAGLGDCKYINHNPAYCMFMIKGIYVQNSGILTFLKI